ncbi:MAG TPA: bacillithiol biosynthesis BshC [Gemmatimonadaceae bacterium]|nr:bacillithiol biosynthesis BshC [Gemmatimonadaceae bacterium]
MNPPTRSRVLTEPLGGSPLSLAVQTRRLPPAIQPWRPAGIDAWREHVSQVRSSRSGWLEALRPAIEPSGSAATRLDRVAAENGVVVTTGQQAGLFGGPLYTLAKALTALTLADTIEQELGVPAAPVFWAATDDADFLEASVASVADADGLHTLRLTDAPPPGMPMSGAPLPDMHALLEQLRRSCGSAAFAEYYEYARVAFTRQRTLGDAYVQMLRALLGELGVAVMDSSHPAYLRAARPILFEALQRAGDINAATTERAAAIRQLGFEPQVEDDRGLSLVFALEKGVKRRLTLDEAERVAAGKPDMPLAPNVLLRPVTERSIFPTVAYVAGPGELAYLTQSNVVAAALDRDPVVGVPRWSCTIVEPFAEKALRRLRVKPHELRDLSALERRLALAAIPPDVAAAWNALEETIRESVKSLGDAVRNTSLMPPEVIDGLRHSLEHKLKRGERRVLAAVKRREDRVRHDLNVLSAALFPLGQRQERVLNYVPMLTRGGPDLVDDMRAAAREHAAALFRADRTEPVVAR